MHGLGPAAHRRPPPRRCLQPNRCLLLRSVSGCLLPRRLPSPRHRSTGQAPACAGLERDGSRTLPVELHTRHTATVGSLNGQCGATASLLQLPLRLEICSNPPLLLPLVAETTSDASVLQATRSGLDQHGSLQSPIDLPARLAPTLCRLQLDGRRPFSSRHPFESELMFGDGRKVADRLTIGLFAAARRWASGGTLEPILRRLVDVAAPCWSTLLASHR